MKLNELIKKNKIISPIAWRIFYARQTGNAYKQNRQLCDRLLSLKDKHSGERCFVIGTGPSLRAEDLDILKANGIDSFGTHRIYKIFASTTWRPTYYVAQDYALIEEIQNEIKAADCPIKILPVYFKDNFGDGNEYMYYVLHEYADSAERIHFSEKANRYISQGFTVTYASIQLAIWMGYSEIYLLGVDHNYSSYLSKDGTVISDNKVKDYFGSEKISSSNSGNLPRLDDSSRGFLEARKYAEEHNVKIYNATRGGKLEIFPRVDFDEMLGTKG
ncbi:MAG: DUF115 domain-containing protein [Lachnospiraceae bacterium]|nr:DUF115 domain-containing protein [Lachnospiraceae bacterium]